jgi:CPA2 family monovalent cation:H+ antiporter-2
LSQITDSQKLRTDILIISRARNVAHARHLYTIGVTDAVPETIEASLQLSEVSLIRLGQDTGLVIAPIHEKRDDFAMSCSAANRRGLKQHARFARKRGDRHRL